MYRNGAEAQRVGMPPLRLCIVRTASRDDTMEGIVMTTDLQQVADDDFCYLTTTGRVSGRDHTIEIWFALVDQTLYMLAGGGTGADWVKNIQRAPDVQVRLRETTLNATGRIVDQPDEDALARRIVVAKYQPRTSDDLSSWGRTALPVAIEIAT